MTFSIFVSCIVVFFFWGKALANSHGVRDKKVLYHDGLVTELTTKALHVTEVCILPSDAIQSIQGGDASSWDISLSHFHSQCLFVKPKILHGESNLLIEGKRHDYWLHLLAEANHDDVYRLSWYLPKALSHKAAKKPPRLMYVAKEPLFALGDSRLRPDWSFTDEHFTYFHWKTLLPIPVVYASPYKHGPFHMINYRMRGNTLIALEHARYWRIVSGSKSCLALSHDDALFVREASRWHHAHCIEDVR